MHLDFFFLEAFCFLQRHLGKFVCFSSFLKLSTSWFHDPSFSLMNVQDVVASLIIDYNVSLMRCITSPPLCLSRCLNESYIFHLHFNCVTLCCFAITLSQPSQGSIESYLVCKCKCFMIFWNISSLKRPRNSCLHWDSFLFFFLLW